MARETSSEACQSSSQCWICGAVGAVHWKDLSIQRPLVPEDLQITDYRYGATLSLVKCGECGFIFSNDKELDELVSLYEQMSDPGYEDSQEGKSPANAVATRQGKKSTSVGLFFIEYRRWFWFASR